MRVLSWSAGLSVFCVFFVAAASGQQVGTDQVRAYMLRELEQELERAGVSVSPGGRVYLSELVARGADSIYERDALNEVVSSAKTLANRLVDTAKARDPVTPTVQGTKADREATCPLSPFC